MMSEQPGDNDADLIRRIAADQDASALAELLGRHAPKVTGDLRRRFRHQLQHTEIDDAVNKAAMNVWNSAGTFDRTKPFGPWFLEIARHAAVDILRGKESQPTCELAFDPPDSDPDRFHDEQKRSPRMEWMVEQLEQIIEHELKGFEQIVARADLAAGGPADTERLMNLHNKTKNNVQATRSKVWKKIRETILEREAQRDKEKVNQ